jgi:hypothetical protein
MAANIFFPECIYARRSWMGYLLKFGLEKQIIVSRIREIGGIRFEKGRDT